MPLYRVEVEESRTWIIYVDAEDSESAENDAEELAMDFDADSVDTYSYARPIDVKYLRSIDEVWVGGEDGEYVDADEYKVKKQS
jgi:hypothetical protein